MAIQLTLYNSNSHGESEIMKSL